MEPLVSILIPAYNAEAFLAETLHSALEQTWKRKEIIVVDDGSTDRTLNVARSFQAAGVKVYRQEHRGAAVARNSAFEKCSGDYIQWLDSDDLLAPEKIELQMLAVWDAPDPRILLSGEWGKLQYRMSVAKFASSPLWCDLSSQEWLSRKMESNVFMQTATWLVSRELTEAAGPWDWRLLSDDDGEYFCRVLMASKGVRFVSGSRTYYRQLRSDSLGYIGTDRAKRDAMWLSMKMHISYLRSLDDGPRTRAACVTYLQNCLSLFYPESVDLVLMAQELALDLGGRLEKPQLSWKFRWASELLGSTVAWQVQRNLSGFKWRLLETWDNFLFHLFEFAQVKAPNRLRTTSPDNDRRRTNQIPVRSEN